MSPYRLQPTCPAYRLAGIGSDKTQQPFPSCSEDGPLSSQEPSTSQVLNAFGETSMGIDDEFKPRHVIGQITARPRRVMAMGSLRNELTEIKSFCLKKNDEVRRKAMAQSQLVQAAVAGTRSGYYADWRLVLRTPFLKRCYVSSPDLFYGYICYQI